MKRGFLIFRIKRFLLRAIIACLVATVLISTSFAKTAGAQEPGLTPEDVSQRNRDIVLSLGQLRLTQRACVQRMLVHLVYLVYLVCLVDQTGNSFRRTRQTRKTGQPDRQARARCASTEDHHVPSGPLFCEQGGRLATLRIFLDSHPPVS